MIEQTEGPFNFGCQNTNNGNCCSASEPCKLLFWRRAAAAIVMASVFSVYGDVAAATSSDQEILFMRLLGDNNQNYDRCQLPEITDNRSCLVALDSN